MRQAASTTIVCIFLAASAARANDDAKSLRDAIARARRLIEVKDYRSASTLLEDVLLESGPKERREMLGILKQSYEVLASEAEAAGRSREAANYRGDVALIRTTLPDLEPAKPASPSAKPPQGTGKPAVMSEQTAKKLADRPRPPDPVFLITKPNAEASGTALGEPAAMSEPTIMPKPALAPAQAIEPAANSPAVAEPNRSAEPAPNRPVAPAANPPPAPAANRPESDDQSPAAPSVLEADRLFSAKKYDDAGRCYAMLAREKRLPANRTNHWAYCRIVGVAMRMNARPKTAVEWDQIEAEIQSIQRLAPNLWYGEYLRNRLAEVRKGRSRAQAKSDNLVVRGSAPDESEGQTRRFPRLFGKSRANASSKAESEASRPSAAPDSVLDDSQRPPILASNGPQAVPSARGNEEVTGRDKNAPANVSTAGAPLESSETQPGDEPAKLKSAAQWQVHETPNFRIFHFDARLAELAADAAEKVRAAQAKRWGSPALQKPWNPRCEIHLHPTGKTFAQATGQDEHSPGFSTIESNGNRITTRRVLLRSDHPQVLAAILPHEVTHVVIADLFTVQQIPRWADEGIAVMSEPGTEQNLRAADLHDPLSAGQVIDLRQLMSTDTPDAKDWSLYYAESVSLTRFLVEQGSAEQLIKFVRESGRKGIEPALRDIYGLGGFAELQERWQAYAREQLASSR